ncbi:unnamed protein product [Caenorhabditis auriculariae]|uniref:Tetratricopeptide repeat protein 30 n=1 Tax=Caenorhabditis auriculariae TaxID=2777116 RepID=A0A8S1GRT9_9PELO|nr:unnamed protein product [Caenorhabditis auriculariae]
MTSFMPIRDGDFTSTIYGLIKEQKFNEAIRFLQYQNEQAPKNRAALSLLAYCYYYTQDYVNAAICYEQLVRFQTGHPQYKLYHAQSLYNAFMMQEALMVVSSIQDPTLLNECVKLEAAIKYREEDIANARILVEQCPQDDPDVVVNLACIEYKVMMSSCRDVTNDFQEGDYNAALAKFEHASSYSGYQPELAYSIALCHYRKKEYAKALKFIADIIDRGVKDHPELSVGMVTEGIDVGSVGNSLKLHETALIEAFNLKFAIEYRLKNFKSAQEALTDMPPRSEHELDACTLHNQALIGVEKDPGDAFAKLQYLLSQNPFPPETFSNLLLLYCKYEYYDLAADVLAENAHLTYKHLSQYQFDYLDAMINLQTSPNDALIKLEAMENDHVNDLRILTKEIQSNKEWGDKELEETGMKKLMESFDEKYLPVLMAHAKFYWDRAQYSQVERLFRTSVDFSREHDTWKLNVAHTIFMQEQKNSKKRPDFYEPIVQKSYNHMMDISAIVLANLCVCYIMTNQNEEAEDLMRKVEREEEEAREAEPTKKFYHVCIINLVIGTLYCSKGNYEFGISRVIKAMEPQERKLGTDTWYYAKRCLLATIETMAKHLVVIRDAVIHECIGFLEKCEIHGRNIPATADGPLETALDATIKNTVTYEARQLKAILLQVIDA